MFKIGLCVLDENDNMVSSKMLSVTWKKQTAEVIKSLFALDLKTEMVGILLEEIKRNMTIDDIKGLLENIKI